MLISEHGGSTLKKESPLIIVVQFYTIHILQILATFLSKQIIAAYSFKNQPYSDDEKNLWKARMNKLIPGRW